MAKKTDYEYCKVAPMLEWLGNKWASVVLVKISERKENETDDAKLVSLEWVYKHDSSVAILKYMPTGCYAERKSFQDKWIIYKS